MIKGNGRSTGQTIQARRAPDVKEIHVVWMTGGLSCDGDSVSITAAMQPSVEDVVMGAIPGLPKVHLHNPVLAYENGDDFLKYWYMAERGELDPFVLVMEGSIPNEKIKSEGYSGRLSGQIQKQVNPSPPVNGSTGWLPRRWPWWRRALARPMAEFMQ
jgi:Ni,Fe-hydrogenase I small subunit